jgi:putative endopeptidase
MVDLIANLKTAMAARIQAAPWMSPATKTEALTKLSKMQVMVGYPDKWRDYSGLKLNVDDLYGNVKASRRFEWNYTLSDLGKPVDHGKWGMTPQTVNAYNGGLENKIVFPAGILQAPYFDPAADPAVNYGAIGAVIGHEISHGFDDKGSQSDGDGNLREWWSEQDRKNFGARTEMLVKQYGSYVALPGYNVNGELTLGENIADNSGLAVAYQAYQLSLGGKAAPVIDDLSGAQRFYMGFGQVWRTKTRPEQLIVQIKSDPHAPGQFRANGTLKNQPGFYEAFDVRPGDRMYLAPEQRVIIW